MKIWAIVCQVGEQPTEVQIDSSLESLQAIVGGYIEKASRISRSLGYGVDAFVNGDGYPLNLPYNRAGYVGPIVIVGCNEEREMIGLTESQRSNVMQAFLSDKF